MTGPAPVRVEKALALMPELEATCSLDGESEELIRQALDRLMRACASFVAVARVIGSGYALAGTFLFGDDTPPFLTHTFPASGLAMNLTNASAAGESLNMISESPPPTTLGCEPLTDGKSNTL